MHPTGRLQAARAFAIGGVGVSLIGTLLPWLRSGERARSSYQLAGVAARVLGGPTATVAHVWLVFPMFAAAAVAALLMRPGRLVVVLAAVVAAMAGVFALLVARVPLPGLVGLWVTGAGASCALAALVIDPRRSTGTSSTTSPPASGAIPMEQH